MVEELEVDLPRVADLLDGLPRRTARDLRAERLRDSAGYVKQSVFFAFQLQPVSSLPQSLHGVCGTPTEFVVPSKCTLISQRVPPRVCITCSLRGCGVTPLGYFAGPTTDHAR